MPLQKSTFHVYPPHETFEAGVPVWSAWQSVFAALPVHVRPVVSFEPLSVTLVYVPVRPARQLFQSAHCALATTFCVKLSE
jgi:hypothetical protein